MGKGFLQFTFLKLQLTFLQLVQSTLTFFVYFLSHILIYKVPTNYLGIIKYCTCTCTYMPHARGAWLVVILEMLLSTLYKHVPEQMLLKQVFAYKTRLSILSWLARSIGVIYTDYSDRYRQAQLGNVEGNGGRLIDPRPALKWHLKDDAWSIPTWYICIYTNI